MSYIEFFINNPYQENTYIIYDETGECVIIDPGMYTRQEQDKVLNFIHKKKLKPTALLNTHCHIDHVLGNKLVNTVYGLLPQFHEDETLVLESIPSYAPTMGLNYDLSPLPKVFLKESDKVKFGETELEVIQAPGHSPGHICFYNSTQNFLISGDVLFNKSIGRTDLPGGNHQQLMDNIQKKILTLPDNCMVYPGHGPSTNIGYEKKHNPFLRQ